MGRQQKPDLDRHRHELDRRDDGDQADPAEQPVVDLLRHLRLFVGLGFAAEHQDRDDEKHRDATGRKRRAPAGFAQSAADHDEQNGG